MSKSLYLIIGMVLFLSCTSEKEISSQYIVDKAIEVAGGEQFLNSEIAFTFRDYQYTSERGAFGYELTRSFIKDSLQVNDRIRNGKFTRFIDQERQSLLDSVALKYYNSVNSVHYFAYLPQGLNDKAVQKELLGEVVLKGEPYYKVRVTFAQEGGGNDYEDVFIYWFHKQKFTMDYLAYEFHVDGGGMRFREAVNPRFISGIRFADYKIINLVRQLR